MGGGQTRKPGSRHKIILHNTREFKEALPTPLQTPPLPLFTLKRGGGDKEREGGKATSEESC